MTKPSSDEKQPPKASNSHEGWLTRAKVAAELGYRSIFPIRKMEGQTLHPVREARGWVFDPAEVAALKATRGLVDRDVPVEVIVLTAVAGEHVLVVGPPGTAKSVAARRVAHALGGRYFEYLLGRFTEPSELFGAVDLAKLREGLVETDTTNMLPEAEIVFLDEVFQGSTAILNTLLGILNERTFNRDDRPAVNDARDGSFLGQAIAYGNIVVTEKRWAHLANKTKIAERYGTKVIGRVDDLPDLLKQEGCL